MLERVFKSRAWISNKGRREIIICANACTDNTVAIVRELQRKHPEIQLLETPVKSKNRAWEMIVRHSNPRAKNLFFADADVLVFPHAFDRLEAALRNNRTALVAGANAFATAGYVKKREAFYTDYVKLRRYIKRNGTIPFQGALFAMRRETALHTQMPSHHLASDDGFLAREFKSHLVMVPDAKVAYRESAPHDWEESHIRRIIAKETMPAGEKTNGKQTKKSLIRKVKGAIEAMRWIGPIRMLRIYHRYMHPHPHLYEEARSRIKSGKNGWYQSVSSKLDSRRRPPKVRR